MAQKIKHILILFSFLLCFTGLSVSAADKDIGEGYAVPTFRELSQTMALMGGLDLNDTKIADEYARLVYCGQYQKSFKDDLAWHKIRSQIISRVQEKKEYFRIFYETHGIFKLGRYDIDGKFFSLTSNPPLVNVGSMTLLSSADYRLYCGLKKPSPVFPPIITLLLNQPLTLNKFWVPEEEVERMLARLSETKNADRWVYGRIRFRITDSPGLSYLKKRVVRAELRGEITAIDFFLDKEMTQPVGATQALK